MTIMDALHRDEPGPALDRKIARALGVPTEPFTTSIDAAVRLVERILPGWLWRVATCSVSDDAWVAPDFNHPIYGAHFQAKYPDAQRDPIDYFDSDIDLRPPGRPALALCMSLFTALAKGDER